MSFRPVLTDKLSVQDLLTEKFLVRRLLTDKLSNKGFATDKCSVRLLLTDKLSVKGLLTDKFLLKGAIEGLRQFLITENTLKMKKNAIYFTLRALFVLKIFKFLSWSIDHVEKTARLERQG